MIARLVQAALCVLAMAAPLRADTQAAAAAQAAADRLSAAAAELDAAESARDRVAALTETVHAYEDGLAALRDGLRRVALRQRELQAQLDSRRDEVARLLGVLETIGRTPAPLLLISPQGPTGTARSGMLLADVTPALQAQADALRVELEEVAVLREVQETSAATLQRGLTGAQDARAALSNAISQRTDLPRRFTEDPVQTALLVASTETLDAFADSLGNAKVEPTGTETPDANEPSGNLPLPVQGRILRGYGEEDLAGVVRYGLVIAARPRALVTTPVEATVRFRGPLLNYGNVIILEPKQGVMFVLAGLAEVFGNPGEILPAGSPVGMLGGLSPSVDEILSEVDDGAVGESSETLYLEVRDRQGPVDPALWFALE